MRRDAFPQAMLALILTGLAQRRKLHQCAPDFRAVSDFLGFVMLQLLDMKIDYRDCLVDFEFDAAKYR